MSPTMELMIFVLLVAVVGLGVSNRMISEHVRALRRRVEVLEAQRGGVAASPMPSAPAAAPAPVEPPRAPRPIPAPVDRPSMPAAAPAPWPTYEPQPRERSKLERVVAEHALSLAGGAFVLIAAVFFVTYAVDQGWIGPRLRMALAAAFGVALAGVGVWLASRLQPSERIGRALGSLHGVLVGVGAAVVFVTIVASVRLEEVMSAPVGVACQIIVASAVVVLARRWRSQDLAGFGLVVALGAPILVGADADSATLALLSVALVGAVVLAATERWPRLLLVAALVTAPQLASYAADGAAGIAVVTTVLLAWWALLAVGCVACALRAQDGPPRSTIATVLATPLVVWSGIELVLDRVQVGEVDSGDRAVLLLAFAALQVALAAGAWLRWRVRVESLAVALVGAGLSTAAFAAGSAADGASVTWAWAAEAVALTVLWSRTRSWMSMLFAAAMWALAVVQAFVIVAPATLLRTPGDSLLEPMLAMAALVVGAVATRLLITIRSDDEQAGIACRILEPLAALAAWYAVAIATSHLVEPTLDSLLLGAWCAVGGLAAAWTGLRLARPELGFVAVFALFLEASALVGDHHDGGAALLVYVPAAGAALALLLVARASRTRIAPLWIAVASQVALAAIVIIGNIPPWNLRAWDAGPVADAAGLLILYLVGCVLLVFALDAATVPREWRRVGTGVLAGSALYAVSVLVVGALTDVPGEVEQTPQVALTLTWVAIAVAALFAGTSRTLRDHRELRVGAYGLLMLAGAKLLLVDTAELETPMRMLTFLLTGLGLLGSAWLERRLRDDVAPPSPPTPPTA
jgi:uncharacterized membrane protein